MFWETYWYICLLKWMWIKFVVSSKWYFMNKKHSLNFLYASLHLSLCFNKQILGVFFFRIFFRSFFYFCFFQSDLVNTINLQNCIITNSNELRLHIAICVESLVHLISFKSRSTEHLWLSLFLSKLGLLLY